MPLVWVIMSSKPELIIPCEFLNLALMKKDRPTAYILEGWRRDMCYCAQSEEDLVLHSPAEYSSEIFWTCSSPVLKENITDDKYLNMNMGG